MGGKSGRRGDDIFRGDSDNLTPAPSLKWKGRLLSPFQEEGFER